MSASKHSVESEGVKPRDHEHPRHHFWKHAHKDWRVWVGVVLMLAMIAVYVMTDSLSLRPGKRAIEPTPEANAPWVRVVNPAASLRFGLFPYDGRAFAASMNAFPTRRQP